MSSLTDLERLKERILQVAIQELRKLATGANLSVVGMLLRRLASRWQLNAIGQPPHEELLPVEPVEIVVLDINKRATTLYITEMESPIFQASLFGDDASNYRASINVRLPGPIRRTLLKLFTRGVGETKRAQHERLLRIRQDVVEARTRLPGMVSDSVVENWLYLVEDALDLIVSAEGKVLISHELDVRNSKSRREVHVKGYSPHFVYEINAVLVLQQE